MSIEQEGFAAPWPVPQKSDCFFYHWLDLPGGESVGGHWDMRGRFKEYVGGVDLRGARVLDVGTASGFLSFEAEKHGAREVVAFDAARGSDRELVPTRHVRQNKSTMDQTLDQQMRQMKNSFWYSHHALNSKVRAYYGRIYDFGDDIGRFDIAIIGQILVHLKHPLSAIEQVARVTDKTIVITEGMRRAAEPFLHFIWDPKDPNNAFAWWHASEGFYDQFLKALDFKRVNRSAAPYALTLGRKPSEVELTTLVYERAS